MLLLGSMACALPGTLGENDAATAGLLIASNIKSIDLFQVRSQDNPGLVQDVTGVIDQNSRVITAFVPSGTDRSALIPLIQISGAAVNPPSGRAMDFRDLVTYSVTGDDGESTDYQVNLRDASLEANSITAFTFRKVDNAGFTGDVSGTIFEDSGVINLTLPPGTSPATLIPTIAVSGSSLSPAAGVAGDFSGPVQYTVTAANGTTRTYTIVVTVARDSSNSFTSFGFTTAVNGALPYNLTGSINDGLGTVHVTVPEGTSVNALIPNFAVSGGTVAVAGSVQTSNTSVQNFSSPVTYAVTAQDGSVRNYSVILSRGITAGGLFTSYGGVAAGRIVRLNLDGTIDTSFNTGTGFDASVRDTGYAGDGSGDVYAVGGFTNYQGGGANRIIRLNSDGSRDTGFNMGTGFDGTVEKLLVVNDGSGDVIAVGSFGAYNGTTAEGIVRLNSDGSIDTGLAVTGGGQGFTGDPKTVVRAQDGSGDFYVGGDFTAYKGVTVENIVRINSDGSLDTGFAVTGTNGGFDNQVDALLPMPDGDVYVGGSFVNYKASSTRYLVRLNADGSSDAGFAIPGTGFDDQVSDIRTAPDGRLFVLGGFGTFNGAPIRCIIKLNTDGSRDTSYDHPNFGFNGGVSLVVYSLVDAQDGSGDFYAGGDYTTFNNSFYDGLTRINADGTPDNGYVPGGFNDIVYKLLN